MTVSAAIRVVIGIGIGRIGAGDRLFEQLKTLDQTGVYESLKYDLVLGTGTWRTRLTRCARLLDQLDGRS